MGVPYTKTETALSVVINFRPTVIPSSHPNFQKLVDLVQRQATTEAELIPLLDIPKAIEDFSGGNVTVVDGRLYYKGFEIKNELATVILNFVKAGKAEAAKPFEMFMEKAHANPDPRAASDLYSWVAAGRLPITPTGDILAWKIVQADYFSIRAGKRGKLRHMIGDVVEEPRHECNSNPDQTCSSGIHFCSLEYIKSGGYASGGSRIMAVAVSPTDVVAFPKDYGLSKGRCCRLTVMGEVPQELVPNYYSGSPVYSGWTQAKPAETAPVAASVDPTPAPAPSARKSTAKTFPLVKGQVAKRRDGREVRVSFVGNGVASLRFTDTNGNAGVVWADTGRRDKVKTSQQDVTSIVRDSQIGFAVGQKWQQRGGGVVTLKSTSESGPYPLKDDKGNRYTRNGRYNSDTTTSSMDLTVRR